MSDLVEFLLARIAEVERKARSVRRMTPYTPPMPNVWHDSQGRYFLGDPTDWFTAREISDAEYRELIEKCSEPVEPDPHVLAECESKRQIIELHASKLYDGGSTPLHGVERDAGWVLCSSCGDQGWNDFCGIAYPCPTLRLLALPYPDHPDYDESWRP